MVEPTSLASLEASFEQEARLDESFVVLTVAASLIAPWILPLRSASFAILQGRLSLAGRALLTLAVGVAITILMSSALGLVARLPVLGDEVLRRTTPNLLDLGIAPNKWQRCRTSSTKARSCAIAYSCSGFRSM
ncbi:MAG: DUF389 domain-containing protein [Vulcanococcus sp.]